MSHSHKSDKAFLIILLEQKYSISDLGVWHLHVELGLLCDVDGIGEAGLLEVSHGEVSAAQGPHEGVLGVLVGRELVVDVEVADALHQAVGRVPRHLVAVALLGREKGHPVFSLCLMMSKKQKVLEQGRTALMNWMYQYAGAK